MKPPSLRAAQYDGPTWIGIDPGAEGAIGAIDNHGRFLFLYDMPITLMGRRGEFEIAEIAKIAREVGRWKDPRVCLEWPQTRPDEAPESSKRFGVGLGILEACFTMVGCPPTRVAPNKWKGRMGLSGKEDNKLAARTESVRMAQEIVIGLPPRALLGPRGGLKDGRAEALLIAWEAMTCTLAGLRNLPADMMLARVMCGPKTARRRKGGSENLIC